MVALRRAEVVASPDTTVGHGRYKKTIFGNLLDLGGSSADRYNQPDRLHMDLIGVSSWTRVETAVLKGADWTVMDNYLEEQTDLPLLRRALLEKARKRAREDADARKRHGPAAADAQYKAEYRHKKETQAQPYARRRTLGGRSSSRCPGARPLNGTGGGRTEASPVRRRALSAWSRTWSAPRRRETSGSPPGSGSPSCPGP
jgi:hypothetical protein